MSRQILSGGAGKGVVLSLGMPHPTDTLGKHIVKEKLQWEQTKVGIVGLRGAGLECRDMTSGSDSGEAVVGGIPRKHSQHAPGSASQGARFIDREELTCIEQWLSPDSELGTVTSLFSFHLFLHPFYGKGP